MNRWLGLVLAAVGWLVCSFAPANAFGQSMTLDVSFRNELAPILAAKCLRCHGPDKAEGDFRVDEKSSWENYAEPFDLENSEVWRLVNSTDEDERMPPDLSEHLTAGELDVFNGWIVHGAKFQEVKDWEAKRFEGTDLAEADTLGAAIWALFGRFHPALVHFPIALLLVAAFFAVFSFGNVNMDKAAVYCLVLGTLGSIAAAASGWGFADYRKWPNAQSELTIGRSNKDKVVAKKNDVEEEKADDVEEVAAVAETANRESQGGKRTLSEEEREALGGKAVDPAANMWDVSNFIFFDGTDRSMHRWGGVGTALLAVVVTLLALYVRRNPDNSQFTWKLSSLVLAGLVSWVGHQGGEIHYGSDLYSRPMERIQQLIEAKSETPEPKKDEAKAVSETKADSDEAATKSDEGESDESNAETPAEETESVDKKSDGEKSDEATSNEKVTSEEATVDPANDDQ